MNGENEILMHEHSLIYHLLIYSNSFPNSPPNQSLATLTWVMTS